MSVKGRSKYKTDEERRKARNEQSAKYRIANPKKIAKLKYKAYWKDPEKARAYCAVIRKKEFARKPLLNMLNHAKSRSKKFGVPFSITDKDLSIPEYCPVLGIKIDEVGNRKAYKDSSPTIDRLIPSLGYVPGNVFIISARANRIKNNSTYAELDAISTWMKSKLYPNAIAGAA